MAEQIPTPRPHSHEVLIPNLGLYLDRPNIAVPKGGMTACKNVRVKNGRVSNYNMGWEKFFADQLNGQVLLIDQFFTRDGSQYLIFGTRYDLYYWDDTDLVFITPIYNTGTVQITDGTKIVTGSGTLWDTAKATGSGNNAMSGYEIAFGASDENDPAATWYEIDTVDSDTQITLTENHSGGAGPGASYTIRQKFTGDDLDIWSSETFPDAQPADEDMWYATNGVVDEMVKWNGTDDTCSWYDPGFTCRVLSRYKNMMLYGDIIESGERKNATIKNSAIANPEQLSGDEAGEFEASDGIDTIRALFLLGDTMVAYHDRSVNLIQYVGTPLNFVIRTAVPGIGVMSGRGVTDFGDFHEFLAYDSCYSFDGVGIQEVGSHVLREALRMIDPNRPDKLLSHIDEENGDIHWVIPLTTDGEGDEIGPKMSFTSHYLEDVPSKFETPMTYRDLPATATGFYQRSDTLRFDDLTEGFDDYQFRWNDRFFAASFPYNLFGDENGYVYILGTADDQDGGEIESYARFSRLALGDGKYKGLVHRIEPFAARKAGASSYDLGVLLWVTDQLDGDLTLAKQMDYDLTHAGNRFVSPRKIGRYGEVEFATTGTNRTWEISGYRMEIFLAGER